MRFFLIFCFHMLATTNVFSDFQKPQPGLLTEDFGVLTRQEILNEIKGFHWRSYNAAEMTGYNIWQCFKKNKYKLIFRKTGDTIEGQPAHDANLEVFDGEKIQHYSPRHPAGTWLVQEYRRKWTKILKDAPAFCVAGEHIDEIRQSRNGKIVTINRWDLGKIKSQKGLWSYFCIHETCEPN